MAAPQKGRIARWLGILCYFLVAQSFQAQVKNVNPDVELFNWFIMTAAHWLLFLNYQQSVVGISHKSRNIFERVIQFATFIISLVALIAIPAVFDYYFNVPTIEGGLTFTMRWTISLALIVVIMDIFVAQVFTWNYEYAKSTEKKKLSKKEEEEKEAKELAENIALVKAIRAAEKKKKKK